MTEKLVEIPTEDWRKLLNLYDGYRKEPSAYGLLKTAVHWIETEPTLNLKIFALDNDWEKDGTYVFIDYELHNIQIYCNTLCKDLTRLTQLLNSLHLKSDYRLLSVPENIFPAIREHIKYTKIADDHIKCVPALWYYIEKEKALQFDDTPPADITFSRVELNHAQQINENWAHQAPGSIVYVERLIQFSDNVGAYDKSGNLVGWCLRLPVGSLGLLHVVEEHKRQGLGSMLVRYMSRQIALNDEEVVAPVVPSNSASCSMFEKLGFSAIDMAYWFTMKLNK